VSSSEIFISLVASEKSFFPYIWKMQEKPGNTQRRMRTNLCGQDHATLEPKAVTFLSSSLPHLPKDLENGILFLLI
jgi:hypothetical protein